MLFFAVLRKDKKKELYTGCSVYKHDVNETINLQARSASQRSQRLALLRAFRPIAVQAVTMNKEFKECNQAELRILIMPVFNETPWSLEARERVVKATKRNAVQCQGLMPTKVDNLLWDPVRILSLGSQPI